MKHIVALIVVAIALSFATPEDEYREAFTNFMHQHQKVYPSEEFQGKYNSYKDNYDFVKNHNAESAGFSVALNRFADLTSEEFGRYYASFKLPSANSGSLETGSRRTPTTTSSGVSATSGPTASAATISAINSNIIDWRLVNAVTPVKDQGQCGACWSFSATGAMEGAMALSGRPLISLSEQNLIDCSTVYGNMGCNGGSMDAAFYYVIENLGINRETTYPYTATGPNQCRYNPYDIAFTISNYEDLPSGDEISLAIAASSRPVSVAIDASRSSFQFYSSGIYYDSTCSSTRLDHGVLVVGYGPGYWLVKNSWGTSWGNAGYIQMSRNRNNNCGIASMASYPIH